MPIYKTTTKKNGITKYRVRVGYTSLQGKHKQVERTAWGIEQARQTEARLYNEYVKGNADASNITIARLVEYYLNNHKAETRATTHDKVRRTIETYILPIVGKMNLSALNKKVCEEWKQTIGKKDLKTSTKNNVFATLRAILNYAVKMDYIPKNPLSSIGGFKDTNFEATREIQYYTAEEYAIFSKRLKEIADEKQDYRCYVFFSIAFYTGMRKGEINALVWSDIVGDTICIRRSVSQKIKGIRGFESPPKNKHSIRDVKMPLPLIKILNEQKERQKIFYLFDERWNVCGGEDYLPDTTIEVMNKRVAEETGLHRIRIHDFRHTHASILCNNGINIQAISKRLGHADVKETWNTYSHLYPEEEDRAVGLLNNLGIY